MREPKNNLLAFKTSGQKPEPQSGGKRQSNMSMEGPQISGEEAIVSGIYRLEHEGNHPIQEELLVQKGLRLPNCAICSKPISYHLVQTVKPIGEDPDFR